MKEEIKISEELRQQISSHENNETLTIVSPTIAVVITSRSEWGSSGGIGYWSQVNVFCNGQSDMKEWQWRDRWSEIYDKPRLAIHGIGEVKIFEENGTTIEIELINDQHGNRTVTFNFEKSEKAKAGRLSEEDQANFIRQAENEMDRILEEKNHLWELKPTMPSDFPGQGGYVKYQEPFIKQKEIRADIGMAAFVIEEQIDHVASNRQMRHELYVLQRDDQTAWFITKDHGYNRHEGGAFLTIIKVERNQVTIRTKSGEDTITL